MRGGEEEGTEKEKCERSCKSQFHPREEARTFSNTQQRCTVLLELQRACALIVNVAISKTVLHLFAVRPLNIITASIFLGFKHQTNNSKYFEMLMQNKDCFIIICFIIKTKKNKFKNILKNTYIFPFLLDQHTLLN